MAEIKKEILELEQQNRQDLSLFIGISRLQKKMQEGTYEHIRKNGLTPAQFAVMEALYHKGSLSVCAVIEKILSTPGNITVVIKNLEKQDYIVRERGEKDKRVWQISLTEKGRKIIETILPRHILEIRSIFEKLSPQDKQELKKILKKFREEESEN